MPREHKLRPVLFCVLVGQPLGDFSKLVEVSLTISSRLRRPRLDVFAFFWGTLRVDSEGSPPFQSPLDHSSWLRHALGVMVWIPFRVVLFYLEPGGTDRMGSIPGLRRYQRMFYGCVVCNAFLGGSFICNLF